MELRFVKDEGLSAFCEKSCDRAEVLLYALNGNFLGRLFVHQHSMCNTGHTTKAQHAPR